MSRVLHPDDHTYAAADLGHAERTTMPMLGAHLDDLDALRDQLTRTASAVGDANTESTQHTTTAVEACRQAATTAFGAIGSTMDLLSGSVGDAAATAGATSWTGANRDRFVDETDRFAAAMRDIDVATRDAFEDYQASVTQLAEALEDFQRRLATSLGQAMESTEGMAAAVEAQRTNLDSVMNQGLGIG